MRSTRPASRRRAVSATAFPERQSGKPKISRRAALALLASAVVFGGICGAALAGLRAAPDGARSELKQDFAGITTLCVECVSGFRLFGFVIHYLCKEAEPCVLAGPGGNRLCVLAKW